MGIYTNAGMPLQQWSDGGGEEERRKLEFLSIQSCLNLCGDDQAKRSLGNFVDQALSLGELGTDIDFLPGLLKR